MVSIIVNGGEAPVKTEGLQKIADLVELIKASIDPEHMITQILLNGRELSEQDWTTSVNSYDTAIIEFETGTPESFVAARMAQASEIVREAFLMFRDARKAFQDGKMQDGNRRLVKAVDVLQAFFGWYGAMMDLVPEKDRAQYDISTQVRELSDTCKKICQQQLYQSWWALGECLEKDLEPKLDRLEDFCRKFGVQV